MGPFMCSLDGVLCVLAHQIVADRAFRRDGLKTRAELASGYDTRSIHFGDGGRRLFSMHCLVCGALPSLVVVSAQAVRAVFRWARALLYAGNNAPPTTKRRAALTTQSIVRMGLIWGSWLGSSVDYNRVLAMYGSGGVRVCHGKSMAGRARRSSL